LPINNNIQKQLERLLLAQSGHHDRAKPCPLLAVKRTLPKRPPMSAFDPKRTFRGTAMQKLSEFHCHKSFALDQ
jgi:hypothetical protein